MTRQLAERAGNALLWRASELGVGHAISLLRILILARLLVPDDFGLMAIAAVTVNTTLQLTEFGVVPALIQRADVEEKHYDAGWSLNLARALAIATLLVLAAPRIAGMFGDERATLVIQALALRPILEALGSIKVAALGRALRFRSLAVVSLSRIVIDTLVAISLATTLGVWALVAGVLSGALAAVVTSYLVAPYRPRLRVERGAIKALAGYGRWLLGAGALAVLGSTVLQVVISRRFGAAGLGIYFLAAKLAFLPSDVASKVVGEVAFPVYARLQGRAASVGRTFQSILATTSAALVPVYGVIIALAPRLVDDVLGPRWQGTVPLIRIMAIGGILSLFADCLVPLFKGEGRPSFIMILEGTQSVVIVLLVWWMADLWGLAGATGSWLPAIGASQILGMILFLRVVPGGLAGLGLRLLLIGSIAAVSTAVAATISFFLPGFIGLACAAIVALAIVPSLVVGAEMRLRLGLVDDLLQAFPQLSFIARGIKPNEDSV